MQHYLANSPDTQALSEGDAGNCQAERRRRFYALQLSVPGLITAAQLQKEIISRLAESTKELRSEPNREVHPFA